MSFSLVPACRQDLVAMCMEHGRQIEKLVRAVGACENTSVRSALTVRLSRAVLGKVFVAFAAAAAEGGTALATYGWLLYGYMVAIDPKIEQIFLDGIVRIRPQLAREMNALSDDRLCVIYNDFIHMLSC
jgi:hypothetical protein